MIPSPLSRFFATLLAALLLSLAAAPARAQPVSQPVTATPAEYVGPINLPGDSVDAILGLLERWTGKDLLRAQGLPNVTLTLILKERITRQEAINAVETLLQLNGIAVTPLGDKFLKVTPLNLAKAEAPDFIDGSTLALPPSGRTASKLFQLQFLQVAEFMPQIAGLLNAGTGSPPLVFDKSNAALITDSITNLQRIETLVARLDRPILSATEPRFYTLQHSNASDVVNKLRTILSGPLQSQIGSATSYNADDRTNQIVLVTDSRQYGFFDSLIAKLDVRSDPNTRNEVIYLKHGAAEDVANVLTQLVTGQMNAVRATQSAGDNRSRLRNAMAPTPAAAPPGAAPMPAVTVTAPAPTAASLGVALDETKQFSALLTILPEVRTNALIVSGTRDDIRLIEELVAKIDTLLAQVRIEVVIAEVTLGDNATSGISALGLQIAGDKLVGFSGTAAGIAVTDGVISPGVVGAGPYDLAAQIALATTPRKSITNILSVPNIVTTHNKTGRIFVGERRPVISSYLNDGNTTGVNAGYRSTVNQQDIGIALEVIPLIGSDGSVQLEIVQTVEDILGEIIIDGNPQPRIGNRETESFVSARSGEIIVLGGLQRTSNNKSTSRLGPIPILGDLFGTRTRENTRTDLVFFLRPTILTNTPADNAAALRQIEELPARQRDRIKEAVGAPVESGS